MNEHGVDLPIWDDDGLCEDDGLDLSEPLFADLRAFAARWEAAVPAEAFDDRWDGTVVQRLVSARYAVGRILPARRRAARREDAAMRELGGSLRRRMQQELGPDCRVAYQH